MYSSFTKLPTNSEFPETETTPQLSAKIAPPPPLLETYMPGSPETLLVWKTVSVRFTVLAPANRPPPCVHRVRVEG
jgi:hypothetical protein